MFTNIEESQSVWLNSSSLESEKEFELVGILLGLAIYNGIILDVRFPLVIYKKLQGEKLDLQDLMSVQPSLAKSLMQLLEFDGDVEDTFCYTFQVIFNSYPGGHSSEFLVGVCRPDPQILTQFQTKMCHFPHPFSDVASKIHTRFQTFVVI